MKIEIPMIKTKKKQNKTKQNKTKQETKTKNKIKLANSAFENNHSNVWGATELTGR